jgi:hypothetical protein
VNIPSRTASPDTETEQTAFEHRLEGRDSTSAAASQLGFMLAGAQWRASWLHGFRSLYLVMEVILLGLAGGLLVSILTLSVDRAWVPASLLVVDATGSLPGWARRPLLARLARHRLATAAGTGATAAAGSTAATLGSAAELSPA